MRPARLARVPGPSNCMRTSAVAIGALSALAPLVALLLDVARTIEHLCQHADELVPALLVERERRAADVHVRPVEPALGRGAAEVTGDVAECRVRQRPPQRRRELLPSRHR